MHQIKGLLRPIYAPWLRRRRRRDSAAKERHGIRAQVESAVSGGRAVKVILGAGETRYAGWIATDIPAFDVLNGEHWSGIFPAASIDRLLAEHVMEHFTSEQFAVFLRLARLRLKTNGRIRLAVPDGYHPDPDYIERVKPGGSGEGADDHKILYTCESISAALSQERYAATLLEYFDADGRFHQQPWAAGDGFIGRSAAHDPRNADGELRYTSLIVDCEPQTPTPQPPRP